MVINCKFTVFCWSQCHEMHTNNLFYLTMNISNIFISLSIFMLTYILIVTKWKGRSFFEPKPLIVECHELTVKRENCLFDRKRINKTQKIMAILYLSTGIVDVFTR